MNDEVIGDILALCALTANLVVFCATMEARTLSKNAPEARAVIESLDNTRKAIDEVCAKYAADE